MDTSPFSGVGFFLMEMSFEFVIMLIFQIVKALALFTGGVIILFVVLRAIYNKQVKRLARDLLSRDWQIRYRALQGVNSILFLFKFKNSSTLPLLEKALHDTREEVRREALAILPKIESADTATFRTLLTLAHGEDAGFHAEAEHALKCLCGHISTVVFGIGIREMYLPRGRTVWNPDVTSLKFPMNNLKRIVVDVEHADESSIERFLTYSLSTLGQRHLKKSVSVVLYGDPERLSRHIYNNLRNVWRRVSLKTIEAIPAQASGPSQQAPAAIENAAASPPNRQHVSGMLILRTVSVNAFRQSAITTFTIAGSLMVILEGQRLLSDSWYGPLETGMASLVLGGVLGVTTGGITGARVALKRLPLSKKMRTMVGAVCGGLGGFLGGGFLIAALEVFTTMNRPFSIVPLLLFPLPFGLIGALSGALEVNRQSRHDARVVMGVGERCDEES